MRIQNNITALNTHRQYSIANNAVGSSAEKLASGYRINRAGDDAAGLAISEKMRAQIRGLNMASKNSQDAVSLVQTAEGALQSTHDILQRMRELAVQSASDTNETKIDRGALELEFQQLIKEIDDTASKTRFNDQNIIDGTFSMNVVTASTSTTAYSNVWASPSTLPDGISSKTYTVTHTKNITQNAVTGVAADDGVLAGASITSSKGTFLAADITYTAATADNEDASLNGIWTLGYDVTKNMFTATNGITGEIRRAAAVAVDATDTATLDFGNLGTIEITNSHATEDATAADFTGLSGTITITNGVTEKDEQSRHTLSVNGEAVDLVQGQNSVIFENSGMSINLASSFVTTAANGALSGTITVTKTENKALIIQTGANQGDELAITIDKMDAYTLGVKSASIGNRLDAANAITQSNKALNLVSTQRAALGALQNRLDFKISNLDNSAENLQAAESRIRDVDMAKEMTEFSKKNILVQAATAMLAQANAAPQNVLSLLR